MPLVPLQVARRTRLGIGERVWSWNFVVTLADALLAGLAVVAGGPAFRRWRHVLRARLAAPLHWQAAWTSRTPEVVPAGGARSYDLDRRWHPPAWPRTSTARLPGLGDNGRRSLSAVRRSP